ncbi:MAG TPA: CDP-alcohol phosphatidyltransferase family protein [Ktedonobacteraceae bacterium]|nr:CDP-alcohol phosphatidyltransferase family protein [Ktedonobacteraceae bacterium]
MIIQECEDEKQNVEHSSSQEQHKLSLPAGSIYSDDEVIVLGPWQQLRQRFLSPVAFVLSRLGISANMLSFASVVFGLGFFLLAPFQFGIAFWLLIASILCDGLDGVEARLTKTNTATGAFTDMFCDQVVVTFSVAGLAWAGLIHPVLAILFVYIYTALVTFLVLHRMQHVSSKGLIRPSRMLLYAAIALYYFFKVDLLNYLLLFYLLTFPLVVLSFWRLKKAL